MGAHHPTIMDLLVHHPEKVRMDPRVLTRQNISSGFLTNL